jgi:RND family efflux transporter MFP subunit
MAGVLLLVVLAALGAVIVQAAPWRKKDEEKPPVPLQFGTDEVVRPQAMKLTAALEFSGVLVAPGSATLRAKAPGTLETLSVAEGARVQAGQVLGRIELVDFTSRQAERQAAIASARTALAQAERSHHANLGLAAQQFIADTALENSRAQVESARAALQAAQAQLATLEAGGREAQLLAPISGIVAKRQALPGEKVAAEQPLLQIVDLSRLELAGQVAAHELALLREGLPVQVRVEGEAAPRAARVSRIAPAVEPGTRSLAVTVALPNPGERLRAGQYAVASARLDDSRERLTLPAAAVSRGAGQDLVWTIEAGRLVRRVVTLGRRDAERGRVEVITGLQAQADVLALPFDNLKEGNPALLPSAQARASGTAVPAPPGAAASAPRG